MHKTRILFPLGEARNALGETVPLPFSLTKEEMCSFSRVRSFPSLVASLTYLSASDGYYSFRLSLSGEALFEDGHDCQKTCLYPFSDSAEVLIDTKNRENSDVLPGKDHGYDIRGLLLSLLNNALPATVFEEELKRKEYAGGKVLSEKEYRKERASTFPFSVLDSSSYPEK